jgi:protein tyrosine phosphatase
LQTRETREIYHCHYTNWPDFGEPRAQHFLKFLFACYEYELFESDENNGPAVIHCSAGVGRSGTLALVDSMLQMVKFLFFLMSIFSFK